MTGSGPPRREDPSWSRRLRHEPAPEDAPEDLDELDRRVADGRDTFATRHASRYLATDGTDDGWDGPRPILLLYTTGRRSGLLRRTPLLYFDHGGERHVVGSAGGADRPPTWLRNVQADPRVHVRVGASVYTARAELLDAADRALVWPPLVERYPVYAEYETRTDRVIPVVRLRPDPPVTDDSRGGM